MNVKLDFLLSLVMALAFGAALLMAKDWPIAASFFPFLIGGLGLSIAIITLIPHFTKGYRGKSSGTGRVFVRRELTTFGWIFGFFGAVALIGFQWGLPCIILSYFKFEARVTLALAILLSAICWGFLYVMRSLLHLPLYEGFIFIRWL